MTNYYIPNFVIGHGGCNSYNSKTGKKVTYIIAKLTLTILLTKLLIPNLFAITVFCLIFIHWISFARVISKSKLLYTNFRSLSRYFNTPPKPHAFASLPLESKAGMWITVIASSSGAVIYSIELSDLQGIIDSLISNLTIPSFSPFSGLNTPSFPVCPLPHIYSHLSDNPGSLTNYGWQLDFYRQIPMFINNPYLWRTKNVVYLFNNPLFLSITALILIKIMHSLMQSLLYFFNEMWNIFNMLHYAFQPFLFSSMFWGVTDPWLIPLRELILIARTRLLNIVTLIDRASIVGRGRRFHINMFNIYNLFTIISIQRPHLGNVVMAGLTVTLAISQLDIPFGLDVDYEALRYNVSDLVDMLDNVLDDMASSFNSEQEDSD